jgi:hypothetical protein
MMGFPAQPGGVSVQDLERFEQTARTATPYFSAMTPADYAANRAFMGQMVSYLGAVDLMARTPQMRLALSRAYWALAGWRYVYPQMQQPAGGGGAAPAPGKPSGPPFDMRAPEMKDVAPADKETADDLRTRYTTDAARAATAWQNAETIRLGLESKGMTLNADTATQVARLQLYLELASGALRARDWTEAHDNLEKVEYETEKVVRAVGR